MTFTTEATTASPPATADDAGTPQALRVVVLSGNPRAGSRTAATGRAAATAIARVLADVRAAEPRVELVELADLAGEVLAPVHPRADAVRADLARADVVVVATPVYKASYTGLLKAFLDLYRAGDLRDVVAVPLVVSGNPAHALAGEVHLRPLLVELGAVVPTRALTVTEAELADLDTVLERWLADAAPALRSTVRTEATR
ncbi:NAD(P)H-dependent oxidoreductase [Luteimicrobium xylanilyticum]|uniref:FMN reductase (NADPH) n=1 Tax=Luteimicrobium xylanilyticum TaxID=1133546 RepID=A0A5P9QEY5_9MICO|nr:NAD(P)H-dependent oxidoreductase [Luteimicrobium xylanilyticum]QFU99620.1 FMN reductase (NADPH) [Luteimicrobium xylanilyticum]